MHIVTRDEWGARPPKDGRTRVTWAQRTHFSTHYTGGPKTQSVRAIQDWCMNPPPHGRNFLDIDYNFLVNYEGVPFEGRGWDYAGSHTEGKNTPQLGVAFIGYDADVTDAALHTIRWLYDDANRRKGGILSRTYHSAWDETSCPGPRLRSWVIGGMKDPTPPPPPAPPKPPAYPKYAGRILKRGMVDNAEVGKFQLKLKQRGWRLTADNDFGAVTEAVVKSFQREKKIPAHGRVDKVTWDKIYTAPVTDS